MVVKITTDIFLDRAEMLSRLNAKENRILRRVGYFTLIALRWSMKYRKPNGEPSVPPDPPKANRKHPLLRKLTAYSVDTRDKSVYVGELAHKTRGKRSFVGAVNVPTLLNDGGVVIRALPGGRTAQARYLPRPFVTADSPAGKAGAKKLRELTEKNPL